MCCVSTFLSKGIQNQLLPPIILECGLAKRRSARILRLARSQTVLALAEMSDGSVRSGAASILVTLGACVEEVWGD